MQQTPSTRPQRARQAPKRYEPEEMPIDDWTDEEDAEEVDSGSESESDGEEDSSSLDSFVVGDDDEEEPSECSQASEEEWSDTEDMEED